MFILFYFNLMVFHVTYTTYVCDNAITIKITITTSCSIKLVSFLHVKFKFSYTLLLWTLFSIFQTVHTFWCQKPRLLRWKIVDFTWNNILKSTSGRDDFDLEFSFIDCKLERIEAWILDSSPREKHLNIGNIDRKGRVEFQVVGIVPVHMREDNSRNFL